MIITPETSDYLDRVVKSIESGKGTIPLTNTCPECGETINTWDQAVADDGHIVYRTTSDTYAVLIGCEGYWVIDPALVGLDRKGWSDGSDVCNLKPDPKL